eukprot:TRINITY_DN10360_c0_g1_i1.p1 TRINITY_DN10360_c0_g1~~TRINITY_DN10360_c0_g1_i1.p1  ORF type:complete len:202 (-),score=28.92 TRINITY_DN10360_c0_g1_i1:12-617(-)
MEVTGKTELPPIVLNPDPTLMWGPIDPSNWVIPGRLVAGGYPGHKSEPEHSNQIKAILDAKITTFVCLQSEKELKRFNPYQPLITEGEDFSLFKNKIKFIHFPIPDQQVGPDEEVEKLVNQIIQELNNGEVIYMHCHGGHGRTGTIIALLLIKLYSVDAETALQVTSDTHKCRKVFKSRSPQTPKQFDQVRRLGAKWTQNA